MTNQSPAKPDWFQRLAVASGLTILVIFMAGCEFTESRQDCRDRGGTPVDRPAPHDGWDCETDNPFED